MIILPVATVLWLLYEWMEHSLIQYESTVVELQDMPKNKELKICLITDLHNNKKNLSKIRKKLKEFHPEFILLAGDMVDKHKTCNRNTEQFMKAISLLKIPVYYSAGNHELSMQENYPEIWEAYKTGLPENVLYLENEMVVSAYDDTLFISGLSLPMPFYQKGSLYNKPEELPDFDVPETGMHIMMAHNPEYVELYTKYRADLIVSGHLHGGLLRLPFIGGVVSPRLRLPKGCDAGLMKLNNNSSLFVSRGLGSHTIPLRFFNRVEINFLVLKGTKE